MSEMPPAPAHQPIGRRRLLRGLGAVTGIGLSTGTAYCLGRQSATSDNAPGSMLAKLSSALDARSFGVTMSGQGDESAALQRAIDAAHRDKKVLFLPGGTALLSRPLSFQGRELSVIGAGMGRTILKAAAPMNVMIDVREADDKIVSPFEMEGVSLDGAGMVQTVLAMRFRHHSVLRNLHVTGGKTGVFESDCWLSRRYNCRTERHERGWFVERNGHSSLWEGCSFIGCSSVHLALGAGSKPDDPSTAVLFRSCDVEFGSGAGVTIGRGVVVSFDDCYIGENIDGVVIDNAGSAQLRGGALFFGHTPGAALLRPTAGLARLRDLKVNGHANATLGTLVAPGGEGQFDALSIAPAFPLAGNPTLPGAPLRPGNIPSAVATRGRSWQGFARGCSVQEQQANDARTIRCTGSQGAGAQFGLHAALSPQADIIGRAVYVALTYTASVPVTLQAIGTPKAQGDGPPFLQVIGALPAARDRQTYVKLDEKLVDRAFTAIELAADGAAGASITLEKATITARADPSNKTIDLVAAA